jgi:predicted lipoprotein with Yx(FWY)xxD motif
MKRARPLLLIGLVCSLASPGLAGAGQGEAEINARGSEFGRMLWADRQAVYMFENDVSGESTCYGRCAKAWPPVLAKGRPEAGKGIDEDLLGTVRRWNGDRQVTYDHKPLYTYAHEGRNEVLCHDVDLNGGYWWVLGPDGEPRP